MRAGPPSPPAAALAAVLVLLLAVVLGAVLGAAAAAAVAAAARGLRPPVVGGGAPPFPFRARSLPPAREMFAALGAGPRRVRRRGGDPVLVRTYPGDYARSDGISNHFTEGARIDCRFGANPTPREAWARMGAAERRGTPAQLRERVFRATGQECNVFNPAFAAWVLGRTAGPGAKVLDPSAGWGDRLIGALAAGAAAYHGYDPNPRLQAGYRRIVAELGGGAHGRFRVAGRPFEDAPVAPGAYDIAFTSPPYFDLETYVAPGDPDAGGQSIGAAPSYRRWLAAFYRPYLANAYRAVRPGGWVVVYIEDVRTEGGRYPLRAETAKALRALGAEYSGRFGLETRAGKKRPRTRWALAWRKPA